MNELLVISNNYGLADDGIGSFAKLMFSHFPSFGLGIEVFTAENIKSSKLYRVFSLKMVRVISKTISYIKQNHSHVEGVVIEYPFNECNPFIIGKIAKMHKICNKHNIPVIMSLHEYLRTNKLRKFIIRKLVKQSDILFSTDHETLDLVDSKDKVCDIRKIPSNIHSSNIVALDSKSKREFVFFGLINKTKAFEEMILAWNKFIRNHPNELLHLNLISSSDLSEYSGEDNISIFHNANDDCISDVMDKCFFGLLPIRPYVDERNATLKTLLSFGVIPVGHFKKDFLDDNDLNVFETDDLSVESLLKSMEIAFQTEIQALESMMKNNFQYEKAFKPEVVSFDYYQKIRKAIKVFHEKKQK